MVCTASFIHSTYLFRRIIVEKAGYMKFHKRPRKIPTQKHVCIPFAVGGEVFWWNAHPVYLVLQVYLAIASVVAQKPSLVYIFYIHDNMLVSLVNR